MWFAFLPIAFVPLWQLAHVPIALTWENVAGDQAVGRWQSSQIFDVVKCAGVLPVAVVPLWQLEHEPVIPA
jgi:hypothetical protein